MRAFVRIDLGNSDEIDLVETVDGAVLHVRARGMRDVLSVGLNHYQVDDLNRATSRVRGKQRSANRKAKKC